MRSAVGEWRQILVPAFLAAQALLVLWASGGERPPAPPDLARFPAEIGPWKQLGEEPVAAEVKEALGATQLLSRTYAHPRTHSLANLLVAWFQSQQGGARQPHSPKVCLPSSGWIPAETGELTLDTADGSIRVNRYAVTNRGQRAVVLYWYQTPRRVTAGEWAAKFWLVMDALRDHRTDAALVRIVAWPTDGSYASATASAIEFGRSLYPVLRSRLPAGSPISPSSPPPKP